MCGRFTQKVERKVITEEFYVQQFLKEPKPSYNVAPGQDAGIVVNNGKINIFDMYRWGLIPRWAKDPSIGNRLINARVESLREKPSFREPLAKKRCIIPADGFFEWKKEDGTKVPYYIFRKDGKPLALAGLWDEWKPVDSLRLKDANGKNLADQGSIRTFTIITKDAEDNLKSIHERMPLIIPPDVIGLWLDPFLKDSTKIEEIIQYLLSQKNSIPLQYYRVSKLVNSPLNNSPECIRPIEKSSPEKDSINKDTIDANPESKNLYKNDTDENGLF